MDSFLTAFRQMIHDFVGLQEKVDTLQDKVETLELEQLHSRGAKNVLWRMSRRVPQDHAEDPIAVVSMLGGVVGPKLFHSCPIFRRGDSDNHVISDSLLPHDGPHAREFVGCIFMEDLMKAQVYVEDYDGYTYIYKVAEAQQFVVVPTRIRFHATPWFGPTEVSLEFRFSGNPSREIPSAVLTAVVPIHPNQANLWENLRITNDNTPQSNAAIQALANYHTYYDEDLERFHPINFFFRY